jgi:hypothetical protein
MKLARFTWSQVCILPIYRSYRCVLVTVSLTSYFFLWVKAPSSKESYSFQAKSCRHLPVLYRIHFIRAKYGNKSWKVYLKCVLWHVNRIYILWDTPNFVWWDISWEDWQSLTWYSWRVVCFGLIWIKLMWHHFNCRSHSTKLHKNPFSRFWTETCNWLSMTSECVEFMHINA